MEAESRTDRPSTQSTIMSAVPEGLKDMLKQSSPLVTSKTPQAPEYMLERSTSAVNLEAPQAPNDIGKPSLQVKKTQPWKEFWPPRNLMGKTLVVSAMLAMKSGHSGGNGGYRYDGKGRGISPRTVKDSEPNTGIGA